MNKRAGLLMAALVAVAGQSFANTDDDIKTLAAKSGKMAHDAVRARQALGVTEDNAARFAALIKIDHTFLYGNHTSLASSEGIKVNAALGDHSALNDSVGSCRDALQPDITSEQRLAFVTACQGKLQDLSNHKILQVDATALMKQRYEAVEIRRQLNVDGAKKLNVL